MKTLVIYDSVFGNTEKVAQSVAKAVNAQAVRAGNIKPEQLKGVELLAVGSPTRAFSPTEAIKGFLKGLPAGSLKGMKAISFDTRIAINEINIPVLRFMAGIFGYAAGSIAKLLEKKGAILAAQPEGFYVKASEGPLKDGELERAADWAINLSKK